jgi:hypothetical protein
MTGAGPLTRAGRPRPAKLLPPSHLIEAAAVTFGRSALSYGLHARHGSAFLRQLHPQLPALLCFSIKSLRDNGGPPHLAQDQHFDLEIAAVIFHVQEVSHTNVSRGLDQLSFALHAAKFACMSGKRTRLKEPSRPQPLIDSHARYVFRHTPRFPNLSLCLAVIRHLPRGTR